MTADDDEVPVLVCAPEDTPMKTADSVLFDADCGHKVWVAASGQLAMKQYPDMVVKCLMCALPSLMQPDAKRMSAPGALESIDREFGEVHRSQVERLMRILGVQPNG